MTYACEQWWNGLDEDQKAHALAVVMATRRDERLVRDLVDRFAPGDLEAAGLLDDGLAAPIVPSVVTDYLRGRPDLAGHTFPSAAAEPRRVEMPWVPTVR